jgi:beta-galactosidase/beta-glucuronidase
VRPQIELFSSESDADAPIASSSTPVDVEGTCGGEATAEARLDLTDVSLWSAEQPTLYVVVITLRDGDARTLDCESARIGFRSVQTRDKRLLVNGQSIMIAGVNRHEHCPDNGKAITEQSMVQDILLLKRNNFNAVGVQQQRRQTKSFQVQLRFVAVRAPSELP